MKLTLSDPVARGFVLDEISENAKIAGAGTAAGGCGVGFVPACFAGGTILKAGKVTDLVNAVDTARGMAVGQVPTSVGVERAFKMGIGLILGEISEQLGDVTGEQVWRHSARTFADPNVGGFLGQLAGYGVANSLKEIVILSDASRHLSQPLSNRYMGLLNIPRRRPSGSSSSYQSSGYAGSGGSMGGPPSGGK